MKPKGKVILPPLEPEVPPPWNEEHWLVVEYCKEEVTRQNHDITRLDGIKRVGWMLNAWSYACYCAEVNNPKPTYADALRLGTLIEPLKNPHGLRRVNVCIRTREHGRHDFPDWERVPELLTRLFDQRDELTPLEFYKAFEGVHPFLDGNGRTGKVLLNWLNGTLMNPVFPPADLFGYPIINP